MEFNTDGKYSKEGFAQDTIKDNRVFKDKYFSIVKNLELKIKDKVVRNAIVFSEEVMDNTEGIFDEPSFLAGFHRYFHERYGVHLTTTIHTDTVDIKVVPYRRFEVKDKPYMPQDKRVHKYNKR